MKSKVLGGYSFKSKNGKDLVVLTLEDSKLNSVGIVSTNVMAFAESLPSEVSKMLQKTYVIDVDASSGTPFAKEFFEIKG